MSKLETNQVDPASGTTLTLGTSGDTVTVSNASVVSAGTEVRSNKLSPATGTALQIGDSGDTITIPSGATITNSGTATGFGGDNTPAFSVGKSGNQSIDNAETMTKVTFDVEHLDTDNAFASNKFTVPSGEGGTYFISFNFRVENNTNSETNIVVGKIYKNGSQLHATDSRVDFRESEGRGAGVTSTVLAPLSAGDYIEFYGGNNADQGTCTIQYRGTLAQGFKIIQ